MPIFFMKIANCLLWNLLEPFKDLYRIYCFSEILTYTGKLYTSNFIGKIKAVWVQICSFPSISVILRKIETHIHSCRTISWTSCRTITNRIRYYFVYLKSRQMLFCKVFGENSKTILWYRVMLQWAIPILLVSQC